MSELNDNIVFRKKTINDIFEEIYKTSKDKDKQIKSLIATLSEMITDTKTAKEVVPLLKEYFDISIKNDDHVIRMARIAQLHLRDQTDGALDDHEYQSLMQDAEEIIANQTKEVKVTLELPETPTGSLE